MPKAAIFFVVILISLLFVNSSYGFFDGDLVSHNTSLDEIKIIQTPDIVKLEPDFAQKSNFKRYLIFGDNSLPALKSNLYSVKSNNGFFSVSLISETTALQIKSKGYFVVEDFLLDLHSADNIEEISKIGKIVGSQKVHENFKYTGNDVKVAIVDTGVDFSNPDIQHSLARDKNNHPIMLDADGQGIVLTNATFIANIDENKILRNYTKQIPENITSSVYKTKEGVFLDIEQNGKGTIIQIYNSFFPQAGLAPIFNGTLMDDMKIGKNNREYIVSQSGIYHLGMIYQGHLQGSTARIQVVPVLVIDSTTAGVYDTIIPDMSTSWEDFTRFDLPAGQKPNYDFDFTDESYVTLGSGDEFLIYDFDDDGNFDYSAGTVGARVLDVYGVIQNKTSQIDKNLLAINGTLLEPMDSNGNFFGIMTDFLGHGTASSASITSRGIQEYDIYNNTKKFNIIGVAPDAKIVPVKSLWLGDSIYGWLWSAGFNNKETTWEFSGKPRADIISNSWGVSSFPLFNSAPGMDIFSLILSILSTPKSLDDRFPGVLMVTSAGNSGHGYGTMGFPNSSPFGISVGATTNNVFVGYGPFKDQPRFGNTTDSMNEVVDFSSRGPGIIGDPKPDLMSIGAHSFTPASVTKFEKDSKKEPFSLFGGTSMAAPLVSGSAALLIESINSKSEEYDPFKLKNILTSTASDLQNDPFTQGSGLVNVNDAIKFVTGVHGMFIVSNDSTYSNIKKILDAPLTAVNSSSFGIEQFEIPERPFPSTAWFAGHLSPGERSTTTFTIENPSEKPLDVIITPETFVQIQKTKMTTETQTKQKDPILNKSDIYAPNYIRLTDVKEHEKLASFYDEDNPIPNDTSLLVLNVNFPFDSFMNKTDDVYADDLKISSLYVYDWLDKNNDTSIDSTELSLINRGGSWGTVQEIRVSEPASKFENIPLVGVYPVPTRYSYWNGDTQQNSTSMNYTLSASYYKKDIWDVVWIDQKSITIPPKSSSQISATLIVPSGFGTGVYQGFIKFQSEGHIVNAPISFVVKQAVQKDSLVLIKGSDSENILFGNGFVKGAFDMVNRYMAGDWRQYYFEINDPTINTGLLDISWDNPDTNLSIFVIDPIGRIIQTTVPSGVFGHFLGWPSLDWLGTTSFSQGGGFFPVNNKNETSAVLSVPINQTGTYSLLAHSTLFGGNSTTEQITITGKFTTILADDQGPTINVKLPEFISNNFSTMPEIKDNNLSLVKYFLDGTEFELKQSELMFNNISDGNHKLTISAVDVAGNNSTKSFLFTIDTTPPKIEIISPSKDTTVSDELVLEFKVTDSNLLDEKSTLVILPNGEKIFDKNLVIINATTLDDGNYEIMVSAFDKANNINEKNITFAVDHTFQVGQTLGPYLKFQNEILFVGIGVAIGVGISLLVSKKIKNSKKQ